MKNNEKTLFEIIADDLAKIGQGDFKDTWTSKTSFSPKKHNEILGRNYDSFKAIGSEEKLSIKIIGVKADTTEETIYEINFGNAELMTHTYFSIQSLLNSRSKVRSLSDVLNKTTIPVIQPNIVQKTGNIIKKVKEEYGRGYKNLCTIDNETNELEAQIDAFVCSLYGLSQKEVKLIMQSLKIDLSHQLLVLRYFK